MTSETEKDIEAKLAVPAENREAPASVSPSNVSFMDEKEKTASEPDTEAFENDPKNDLEQSKKEADLDLQRTMSGDYPKAFRLISILIAVMLAIFLVALDMVSNPISLVAVMYRYR